VLVFFFFFFVTPTIGCLYVDRCSNGLFHKELAVSAIVDAYCRCNFCRRCHRGGGLVSLAPPCPAPFIFAATPPVIALFEDVTVVGLLTRPIRIESGIVPKVPKAGSGLPLVRIVRAGKGEKSCICKGEKYCGCEFLLLPLGSSSMTSIMAWLGAEAGTITFILISDHILHHCSKIDLRSYQDHIAVQ
jgi:hypothetical protein